MSQVLNRPAKPAHSVQVDLSSKSQNSFFYGCGLILLLTLAVYWPALQGGFIWDDDSMLTNNAAIKSPQGLYYIWCTTALPDYFPLTSSTLWLEWRLWGIHAWGYHLINVLLHAASAMVLWRVLRRLAIPAGWVIAAIFAAHPVNVESVAWITERKNTLAMFFYALTWYAFVRSSPKSGLHDVASSPRPSSPKEERGPASRPSSSSPLEERAGERRPLFSPRWYCLSLFFFLLALLSKTAVVMFPFALLLLVWWQQGRITLRDILRSAPFFVLSLVLGLVTMWFQSHRAIAGDVIQTSSFWTRLAVAGWAFWFYLYKALCPISLSFVYPGWDLSATSLLSWVPLAGCIALFALSFRCRKTWGGHALFALGYFLLMLFPLLGFVNVYFLRYSPVADHWQYFALPGVIAGVVAGLATAGGRLAERNLKREIKPSQRKSRSQHPESRDAPAWIGHLTAGACILVLSVLSFDQARSYQGVEGLWKATLKKNPQAWMVHNNLGQVYASQHRLGEAMDHYATSLRIKRDQGEGHNNLGSILMDLGRFEEAEEQFHAALKVDPKFATAIYNLGNLADRRGNREEALRQYQRALELNPDYSEAHNNLGCLLAADGKLDDAVQHFRVALRFKPDYPDACNNLGSTLTEQNRPDEAQPFLRHAIEINPNYADAHYNLGNALVATGHMQEAMAEYARAVQLKPSFPEAHSKMGAIFLQNRQFEEAMKHFSTVLQLQPRSAEAYYQMAVLFSAQKNTERAIAYYQGALRINPDLPDALNSLAWIYATAGDEKLRDGAEAVRMASRAAELTGRRDPAALDTLAAAEAESGHFALAISTADIAADLAENTGRADAAKLIRHRLESYRQNKPWRD